MMEYKFGKPIDDLILDSIKQANGEQREVSNALDHRQHGSTEPVNRSTGGP